MSYAYDCSDPGRRAAGVAHARDAVTEGHLVVLPTDTLYGVGCDAFNPEAVNSLLAAKHRGPDMPVPVLVGSWDTVAGLVAEVTDPVRRLVEAFWPGGVSLVVPQAPSLSWNLGNTSGTVMLRMPLHPVAIDLLRATGPMAVSSANISGQPPATVVAAAQEQLGDAVEVYLDGGTCATQVASTIVDLTGMTPVILREGAVSADRIAAALGLEPGALS